MAPFWRDLNLNTGGTMSAALFGLGGCGGSALGLEWLGVPHFGDAGATVNMQVWIFSDSSCLAGVISYQYGDMSTGILNGGTIGVENSTGTLGDTRFYNGAGIAPSVDGEELVISATQGGSATLGFQVTTDCSEDLVINSADLSHGGGNEKAIALTSCE